MMDTMNRREFMLATTMGGLGLMAAPSWAGPLRLEAYPRLQGQGMHVRHNVYCLSPRSREIRSYAKAVGVMQARSSSDPTSWSAQAAIHGTLTPTPGMIVNACEHGTRFFLSWHRMFLYYFERIVRKASGDPAFALPYWGYSPTGDRVLPIAFRTPATAANALYVAARRTTINGGSPIAASAVDAGAALGQLVFDPFSFTLEGTPHGVVHVAVGGWMGSVPTAARDPIFWLHHANIDRLWDVWIASGAGRADPSDAPWLNVMYDFYDENGTGVSMTGTQVLDDARQLRYQYAPDMCGQGMARGFDRQALRRLSRIPLEPRNLALEDTLRRRPALPQAMTAGLTQAPVSLGAEAVDARLALSADARKFLDTFARESQAGNRVVVKLEDVRLEGEASVFYEIYVDLPEGTKDGVYTGPNYLGNLDFFGMAEGPKQRRFNLVPVFLKLRELNKWVEDSVRFTFVPRAFTEGETPRQLLGDRVQAVVGRISIQIE